MIRSTKFTLVLLLFIATTSVSQDAMTTTWSGTLDAPGKELRMELDITINGDETSGELRSLDQNGAAFNTEVIVTDNELSFSVSQIRANFKGEFNADKDEVNGTFSQSGVEIPLTLTKGETRVAGPKIQEELAEAWVGKLDMGIMNPIMQFRVMESTEGNPKCYFDSITEGQMGFAGTWSIEDGELSFKIPAIRLKFKGQINESGDKAEGTWSQGGRELPLTLKRQPTEYDNENTWQNRPQRPVGPFPYRSKLVTFDNEKDGVTLAGTLTVPKPPGRHPVVILISGSGPQDRDESIAEHKPFLVLADYLSRRGIAVLRYDDRGTEKSTGKFKDSTTADFAEDASAAVEFLKSHESINPNQIGLAGHSEGGLIAPMVCSARDDVAFVVLMAATGVDGLEIITSQTEAMLRAEMTDPHELAEAEVAIAMNRLVVSRAVEGDLDLDDPELQKEINKLIGLLPEGDRELAKENIAKGIASAKKRIDGDWMKFFVKHDPRPLLSKIQCPVLAIIGSKDLQVLPDLNMPEIEKALKRGGNNDFEMVTLEGLNHMFQKCETGSMNEYMTIQETWNPVALKRIGDWIEARVTFVE